MKLYNVLNFISGLVFFISVSLNSFANEKTDLEWKQRLDFQGINFKEQAYCYTDESGKIQGANTNMKVRLASVTKLITSLWAIDTLGGDYKYDTKLYIKGKDLHIKGSYDPFLGNEKMFFLISQLNELGYYNFENITFDKNVIVNPDVFYEQDEYPVINGITMAKILKNYFNTKSWSQDDRDEYRSFYSLAKTGRYRKEVKFEAINVLSLDKIPFAIDESVKVLTLSSPPLYKYLKQMNIKSNNYVAETVFRQIGGTAKFPEYLKNRFNYKDEMIYFYTGSGLPKNIGGVRKDNFASCGIVLRLINELKIMVEKEGKELEAVVAVPGNDKGTFRNRIISSDYKNSFVAKTGTLMHTSALAGALSTQKGFSFFGIFNQSTDIKGSKVVQNYMVKSIMTELGGPLAFDYEVEAFHAYNGDNVKNFSEDVEFSSIENDLY